MGCQCHQVHHKSSPKLDAQRPCHYNVRKFSVPNSEQARPKEMGKRVIPNAIISSQQFQPTTEVVEWLNHQQGKHESKIPAHNSSRDARFAASFEEIEWQHKARQYEENADPQLTIPESLEWWQHGPEGRFHNILAFVSHLFTLHRQKPVEEVTQINGERPYSSQAVHKFVIDCLSLYGFRVFQATLEKDTFFFLVLFLCAIL